MSTFYAIVLIAVGLATLFAGVRFYRLWVTLNGTVFGFLLSTWITQEISGSSWVSLVVSIITAVVLAILSYRFYKIGFVVSGALVGALVAVILSGYIRPTNDLVVLISMGVGAILFAVLAMKLIKPFVIVASSLSGALTFMMGLGYLIGGNITASILDVDLIKPDNMSYPWYYLVIILIMALIGIIFQTKKYAGMDMNQITEF
jgi:hypothetical protein